jgi:hypothetical protein
VFNAHVDAFFTEGIKGDAMSTCALEDEKIKCHFYGKEGISKGTMSSFWIGPKNKR